jgi:hypothetical protein
LTQSVLARLATEITACYQALAAFHQQLSKKFCAAVDDLDESCQIK